MTLVLRVVLAVSLSCNWIFILLLNEKSRLLDKVIEENEKQQEVIKALEQELSKSVPADQVFIDMELATLIFDLLLTSLLVFTGSLFNVSFPNAEFRFTNIITNIIEQFWYIIPDKKSDVPEETEEVKPNWREELVYENAIKNWFSLDEFSERFLKSFLRMVGEDTGQVPVIVYDANMSIIDLTSRMACDSVVLCNPDSVLITVAVDALKVLLGL